MVSGTTGTGQPMDAGERIASFTAEV